MISINAGIISITITRSLAFVNNNFLLDRKSYPLGFPKQKNIPGKGGVRFISEKFNWKL
jgi:hypothetical protein